MGAAAAPGFVNDPIGGGPLETGAGAGMSDPGRGGALPIGGTAICPTSGTTLGTLGMESGTAGTTATGLIPPAEELRLVSTFSARLICTTASTHSVPQAIAEERSRTEDRMVDGGVTSC